jgi:hypothetical protein
MPGADSDLPFFSPAENRRWHEIRGSCGHQAARLLYQHAFESSPEGVAVEIGTFAGKSAVCIGRALRDSKKKSKLTLIDVRLQPDLFTNLEAFGLADSIDTVIAPSLEAAEEWKKKISFIYIDGHHGKAHAYADFLVWEGPVMPGGVIALDDTVGFQLGPLLQIEAAVQSGAYEFLPSPGGQCHLRKKRALLPGIGDYPMLSGSLLAYVNYVSAWIAAMDPELRLPIVAPWWEHPAPPAPPPKRLLDRILDASPRSLARFAVRKVRNWRSAANSSAPASPPALSRFEVMAHPPFLPEQPLDVLEWLETMSELDPQDRATVSYLRACVEIQRECPQVAIEILERLSELEAIPFLHYDIEVRQLSALRLAQALDLSGSRDRAELAYRKVLGNGAIAEIRHQAEAGLARPFRLPELTPTRNLGNCMLDSPLYKYRKHKY